MHIGDQPASVRLLPPRLTRLEANAIGITREVVAELRNPVMLYSTGNNSSVMVDDARLPLEPGETPQLRRVRFRTVGCYPLTGAIPSAPAAPARTPGELRAARDCKREGRLIDRDEDAATERKKHEGYF